MPLKNCTIRSSAEFRKTVGTSTSLHHVSGATRYLPLYGGCMKDVRVIDTTKVEDRLSLRKLAAREPVAFDIEGFVEQDQEEGEVLEIIGYKVANFSMFSDTPGL